MKKGKDRTEVFPKALQCDGKQPFTSRDAANQALRSHSRRGFSREEVGIYDCPHCGAIHIGTVRLSVKTLHGRRLKGKYNVR